MLKTLRGIMYISFEIPFFEDAVTQITNLALLLNVDLCTSIQYGIRFFDGPLKHHSVWLDGFSPKANRRPGAPWYDECLAEPLKPYYKTWFKSLIRYDRERSFRLFEKVEEHSDAKYVESTVEAFIGGHMKPWLESLHDKNLDVLQVEICTYDYMVRDGSEAVLDKITKLIDGANRVATNRTIPWLPASH